MSTLDPGPHGTTRYREVVLTSSKHNLTELWTFTQWVRKLTHTTLSTSQFVSNIGTSDGMFFAPPVLGIVNRQVTED